MSVQTFGTRRFWLPNNNHKNETESQILKNSGYVSIVLDSIHYNGKATWWQRTFGGTSHVTFLSDVKFITDKKSIQSKTVQKSVKVDPNLPYFIGLSNIIALKVPTTANGIELTSTVAKVDSDNLQKTLDLLSSEELKTPLSLAPAIVGQVISITNIIKKAFTEEKTIEASATYPGIISKDKISDPLSANRLLGGNIILLSSEEADVSIYSDDKMTLDGGKLFYNGKPISVSYVIYSVSFDKVRGIDQHSEWFSRYKSALTNLDKIYTISENDERQRIFNDSIKLWSEGNVLLNVDGRYLHDEARSIQRTYLQQLKERYSELISESSFMDRIRENLPIIVPTIDIEANDPVEIMNTTMNSAHSYLKDLSLSGNVLYLG